MSLGTGSTGASWGDTIAISGGAAAIGGYTRKPVLGGIIGAGVASIAALSSASKYEPDRAVPRTLIAMTAGGVGGYMGALVGRKAENSVHGAALGATVAGVLGGVMDKLLS